MFEDTNHITDELLIKYLLRETSYAESDMVEAWLRSDPANWKHYNDFKLIWETSSRLASTSVIDEDLAWKRMQRRLHNEPAETPVKQMVRPRFSRIAAIFLLFIAGATITTLYLMKPAAVETKVVKAESVITTDSLPDGSVVTLNKTASLSYPSKFQGKKRQVTLQGEAFFNVAADKENPFIISTGDVEIKVVGTSFNVKTVQDSTEVIVETGVVEVTRNSETIRLMPGEKLLIKREEEKMVKEEVEDRLYNYYASKEFVCVNTPLWKLVEILNEAYDVHIIISNKEHKRLPLTTTFNNESLDNILTIISQTFNISVNRSGDSIILN